MWTAKELCDNTTAAVTINEIFSESFPATKVCYRYVCITLFKM